MAVPAPVHPHLRLTFGRPSPLLPSRPHDRATAPLLAVGSPCLALSLAACYWRCWLQSPLNPRACCPMLASPPAVAWTCSSCCRRPYSQPPTTYCAALCPSLASPPPSHAHPRLATRRPWPRPDPPDLSGPHHPSPTEPRRGSPSAVPFLVCACMRRTPTLWPAMPWPMGPGQKRRKKEMV